MKPDQLQTFMESYSVSELVIHREADIRNREISQVEVRFDDTSEGGKIACDVAFKLLEQGVDTHRFLARIGPPPQCEIQWTEGGQALGADEKSACITRMINAIDGRVAKVHKEQSILHIQPVGHSFMLMGRTRFDVLSEGSDGQLQIRLHHPEGTSEAGLNANDLLDGLYSGLITRA